MSEHIGNQHNFLCPQCKTGNQLQVVVKVWADFTPDGTSIDDMGDEWDNVSLARCACGWKGRVKDFINLPEGEGRLFKCHNCHNETHESQLDQPMPLCPSCGALIFPTEKETNGN